MRILILILILIKSPVPQAPFHGHHLQCHPAKHVLFRHHHHRHSYAIIVLWKFRHGSIHVHTGPDVEETMVPYRHRSAPACPVGPGRPKTQAYGLIEPCGYVYISIYIYILQSRGDIPS